MLPHERLLGIAGLVVSGRVPLRPGDFETLRAKLLAAAPGDDRRARRRVEDAIAALSVVAAGLPVAPAAAGGDAAGAPPTHELPEDLSPRRLERVRLLFAYDTWRAVHEAALAAGAEGCLWERRLTDVSCRLSYLHCRAVGMM